MSHAVSSCRRAAGLLALLLASTVTAQERLSVQGPNPGTVKLGDAAVVQLRIDGKTADPRPPKLPEVPGLQLELSAPSRSSTSFFDGRSLTENLTIAYQLTLRPQREGSFVVPPFGLWTGTREQRTPELRLDARRDLRGEELGWLEVKVEPQRVYVHEPIRVHVEFGIQNGLRLVQDVYDRYRYLDVEVQAPWLQEFPGGERIELPAPQGDLRLIVGNRQLFQAQFEADHVRGGERWQRFYFDRAFLPTRLGTIELPAPMLRYHVLVREGQPDLFGRARGGQSDNFYVSGKPITIEVLPIPEAGRPTPYYGAVGRFAIEASLDRDRVKVGSSVKLTLTIRGRGNFEFLRLPSLAEWPGFHEFGRTEVQRDADRVVVTYDLAPLSTDVQVVPAIEWNFFDTTPGVEKFVQVATAPLPLHVEPLANGETLAPLAGEARRSVTPGKDDVFDLPDLAGPAQVVAAAPAWTGWLALLAPWLVVALGRWTLAWRRRAAADVDGARARSAARACRKALDGGAEPLAACVEYLAARLGVPPAAVIAPDLAARLQAAGLDPAAAAAAAELVDRGTAARYGGAAPLAAAAVLELVQRLEGARFGVHGVLPFLLWPLLAIAGAPALRAQGADPEAAVAAYRAGDHRAAELGFAAAFEATGDRRYWQARGNCFYRLGELPRARWAYEAARRGAPRDAELLANLRLVRQRLQLDAGPEGFAAELAALRERLTAVELQVLLALCMLGAAGCLGCGWRRIGLRWTGGLLLVPGVLLALEVLWLGPQRPPLAIALQELALRAEPRLDLEPVATVRPGMDVVVLGGDFGAFVRVAAGDRSGYVPRSSVAIVP